MVALPAIHAARDSGRDKSECGYNNDIDFPQDSVLSASPECRPTNPCSIFGLGAFVRTLTRLYLSTSYKFKK